MQLLVTMSVPKPGITNEDEGERFQCGRIELIDWEQKQCMRAIEYRSPLQHVGEGLSIRFTGGCPHRGKWYQCTATEIVVYDVKRDWAVERVLSHPAFNDVHGVAVTDQHIVVANTGLEMVQYFSHSGEIEREVNLASTPTWQRFDRNFDYRRIGTTKPHETHVNHAFRLDGQWWATRCVQKDAIRLEDPRDRIEIGVGNPHDGIVRDGLLYFTTTNAHLVIVNPKTRKTEEVIDINRLNPEGGAVAWCRGLEVVDGYAYVGFTRLRRSNWVGMLDTIKDLARGRKRSSHIEKIDLKRKLLVDSYEYERAESSAIFCIFAMDRVTGALPHE